MVSRGGGMLHRTQKKRQRGEKVAEEIVEMQENAGDLQKKAGQTPQHLNGSGRKFFQGVSRRV